MRKLILLFISCITLATSVFAQNEILDIRKTGTFIKVWGFLKYYHPKVGAGDLDWDTEFLKGISEISRIDGKENLNKYYLNWIESLGAIAVCKSCNNSVPESLKYNLDLDWLKDSTQFSSELIDKLNFIRLNRRPEGNTYVQHNMFVKNTKFNGEKVYLDSIYPTSPMRLLSIARYWNIIEYFFPYKYLIGQNWNNVLLEMIPFFKNAPDIVSYHMAMKELTTKINDSHANFNTKYTSQFFGLKWAPFIFKIIDEKAIVTHLKNDSLCQLNDIKIGDVFLEVDRESIADIILRNGRYIGGSNEASKLRNFYGAIFNGNSDSVLVKFDRNGLITEKYLYRYLNSKYISGIVELNTNEKYKILDGNIGYVNMGLLEQKDVKKVMKKLASTKGIIFDVRNYPNGTMYKIANFLNKEKKAFVKFTDPDLSYPGKMSTGPVYYCGSDNKNYYKGKVVLLCNEMTQSHAEFTLMALQTAPDVTTIGSQTAGADGNVSEIIFPGNYRTLMTGLGVYYPDGRETQRIGIVPDIEVKPTIAGIRAGKDEVLEKALEILNK